MPVEITELCNLGQWFVSSKAMAGETILSFKAVIDKPVGACGVGIARPKGFEF